MSLSQIVDQIKSHSISQTIALYLPLSKRGKTYECICPFHNDTKPSLKINDQMGIYKCFACGAAGDHINFVSEYRKIDFIDAVKEICEKLNISTDGLHQKKDDPKTAMAFRILDAVSKIYEKMAFVNHQELFEQFLQERKLKANTAKAFHIGYAPAGNIVLKYLTQNVPARDREFALKVAEEIGIIKPGQNGLYDAFRHRITFAIKDQTGRIRGFSCRRIDPKTEPKYLNSKESFIFNKRKLLYGLDLARIPIRQKDQVILCEGNMDAVSLHQFGFNQAIATMGIAFTEEAINRVLSLTHNVYMAMDSDAGGQGAMSKMNQMFLAKNLLVKAIELAPAKDPDDFLKQHGTLAFEARIEKARYYLDIELEQIVNANQQTKADDLVKVLVEEVFALISPLKESMYATERVIRCARELGLETDNTLLLKNYQAYLAQKSHEQKNDSTNKANQTGLNSQLLQVTKPVVINDADQASSENPETTILNSAEKALIKQLLHYPQLLSLESTWQCLDFVTHSEVKRVILWLKKLYLEVDDQEFFVVIAGGLNSPELGLNPSGELASIISSAVFGAKIHQVEAEVLNKMANDLISLLNTQALKNQQQKIKKKLVSLNIDDPMYLTLSEQYNQLNQQLKQVKK
jgi:DNA primase